MLPTAVFLSGALEPMAQVNLARTGQVGAAFALCLLMLWILGAFVGCYLYLFFACLFGRACSRSRIVRYGPS